jgi:hypothetical protein
LQGFPVRFVVRFTALPGHGEWEAVLLHEEPGTSVATATGASPEVALTSLMPLIGRWAGHAHQLR